MNKKYKLKGWVVVSVYLVAITAIVGSLFALGKTLKASIYSNETLSYVYKGIFEDVVPVIEYDAESIIKPYEDDSVSINIDYYKVDATNEEQENSLINYQNTFMPNTGILYSSENGFEVLSVLDGTVESIVPDELMGNIVTIKHSNNLSTIYESLNEVKVLVGDLVKQGDVLGTSGTNKVVLGENMLLFEVIKDGEYLNPNEFYNLNIEELN